MLNVKLARASDIFNMWSLNNLSSRYNKYFAVARNNVINNCTSLVRDYGLLHVKSHFSTLWVSYSVNPHVLFGVFVTTYLNCIDKIIEIAHDSIILKLKGEGMKKSMMRNEYSYDVCGVQYRIHD